MNWFKHMTNANRDPVIRGAIEKFGLKGYAVYFILLEVIGENLDIETPGKLRTTWEQTRNVLGMKRKTIENILDYFSEQNKLRWEFENGYLYIHVYKVVEFTDEYTKKKLRKMSGQAPDKLRTGVRTMSGKCPPRTDKKRYIYNTQRTSNNSEDAPPPREDIDGRKSDLKQPNSRTAEKPKSTPPAHIHDEDIKSRAWAIQAELDIPEEDARSIEYLVRNYWDEINPAVTAVKDRIYEAKQGRAGGVKNVMGYFRTCVTKEIPEGDT